MTSHPSAPVIDMGNADNAGMDAELNWAPARRLEDGGEPGSHRTTAGLIIGLMLCAGSSALMIWLATLLF